MTNKYKALLLAGVLATIGGNAFATSSYYGEIWYDGGTANVEIPEPDVEADCVGIYNSHAISFTGEGTVVIDSSKHSDWFAIEAGNSSTINFGTADKWLTQLTAKTTAEVNTEAVGLVTDNAVVNIYAKKYEQSGVNRAGIIVQYGGALNINAEEFTSQTKNVGIRTIKAHTTINAKTVNITSTENPAIQVQNNTEFTTAPEGASSVSITADTIYLKGKTEAVDVFSNGQLTLYGNTTIDGNVDVRGNSTTNINTDGKHTTVLNGDIVFETPNTQADGAGSGKKVNANVNLNLSGEGSSWTGSAYQQFDGNTHGTKLDGNGEYHGDVTGLTVNVSDGAVWNMTEDSFVNNTTVSDGGSINISEEVTNVNAGNMTAESEGTITLNGSTNVNAKTVTLDDGIIDLNGAGNTVNIDNLNGSGTVSTNTLDSTVSVANKDKDAKVTVKGSSEITDLIASGKASLQDLAGIVTDEGKGGDTDDSSVADSVETEANDINGGYSADISSDGKVDTSTVVTHENTTNRAVSDMASISLMTWRQENNDMNKRLGELRDSKGEHGAWVRMARGQSKYGAQHVKNQYNYYQLGYDQKLGASDWTMGVAISRTEGKSSFTTGSGENNHTGFAIYGSHLSDNGSFIDVIAKYARMDHDYVTTGAGVGNADYDTNGYSFSAEYGKRFTKDSGLWIEPQVELTYGKVTSADYTTSKGAKVHQDSMDSFVSRFGFALGQNFKRGNAYIRASYLYDFEGKTDVTMSKEGAGSYSFHQDLGGGWWEVGIGANINFSDTTHLYFDVEKTYGGTVATPWQWNLGIRFSF